ncbi:MAG TPA: hypothetical protein VFO89_07805 [Thermoanaerobaculia bacterium]|nr:hypothetical protein [Thermoanaerobaculia bacterium]
MCAVRPEIITGVVFRLGRRSEQDLFYADGRVPIPDDFNLGTNEKADADIRRFAQLSVWDETLASPEQAREFLSPNYRLPLWLSVAAIREIAESDETPQRLRVFRDPETRQLPGAEGHCVIENVWPSKRDFRRIRADLVGIAKSNREDISE